MANLGLIGEEFKNCRSHLLKHLEGNIAWRHPEDAIAQRERLKQKRIAAKKQAQAAVTVQTQENDNVPDENSEPTEGECDEALEDEKIEEESFGMSM